MFPQLIISEIDNSKTTDKKVDSIFPKLVGKLEAKDVKQETNEINETNKTNEINKTDNK